MSESKLSYEELLQIVKVFDASSEFHELHLKYGDVEVDLRKHGAVPDAAQAQAAADHAAIIALRQPSSWSSATEKPVTVAPTADHAHAPSGHTVRAPVAGTFYCAPSPGAAPFVSVGQRVAADSTVCIVEVMKLMNSVKAGVSGIVTQVLAQDGQTVHLGQALIVVDTNQN